MLRSANISAQMCSYKFICAPLFRWFRFQREISYKRTHTHTHKAAKLFTNYITQFVFIFLVSVETYVAVIGNLLVFLYLSHSLFHSTLSSTVQRRQ